MYSVERINQWIVMSDGVHLAAKLWLPAQVGQTFPAILEFLPYRHADFTYERDEKRHTWFCSQGYVCVRVDMRGTGNSEGLYFDEYEKQEQDDCIEVIDWISHQSWCTGAVGMYGKSWGGFNSLQVAYRQPPALKAIISLYSTDDRYMDDVHHVGGCVIGSGLLSWASYMLARNSTPPLPWNVGDSWKTKWLDRLKASYYPWAQTWLAHLTKDNYWRHASISENYSKLKSAVLLIGGWEDCYTNPVFRMVQHLECPCHALVGPWSHEWPDCSLPGPRIGYLTECLRWWDKHLKGVENGVMDDPKFMIYMREGIIPEFEVDTWPGRWISEGQWPSKDVQKSSYQLTKNGNLVLNHISSQKVSDTYEEPLQILGSLECGQSAGSFLSFGAHLPLDQRIDDGLSLCWQTEPLKEPLNILGSPEVTVHLSSDQPQALVVVRLCDVFPNGTSCLISRGYLNLTHRNGHAPESVQPLVPGHRYTVNIPLDHIGHSVVSGHRLRIALSPTYWPLIWPSPKPVLLSIFPSQCELSLPVRLENTEVQNRDHALRDLGKPEKTQPVKFQEIRKPSDKCKYERDLSDGLLTRTIIEDSGHFKILGTGEEIDQKCEEVYTVKLSDPLSSKVTVNGDLIMQRKDDMENTDWLVNVSFQTHMTCDEKSFYLKTDVKIKHDKEVVFDKSWGKEIARFGV